jgi:hypothetical protein
MRGIAIMSEPVWGNQQGEIEKLLPRDLETVEGVFSRLVELQNALNQASPLGPKNSVSSFNQLYGVITNEVLVRLGRSPLDGGFRSPKFLERLDVEFANRYLEALDYWTNSSASTPASWELLFRHRDDAAVPPLLSAVLGVNAHVNFDLCFALIDTLKALQIGSFPNDDSDLRQDFLLVNDIFFEYIPTIRRGFLTANDDAKRRIDKIAGPLDDWIQNGSVVVARNYAWTNARELWDLRGDQRDAKRSEIDKEATRVGKIILSPGPRRLFGQP